jgi:hypothetical protein
MCDSVAGILFHSGMKNETELENLVHNILTVIETKFIFICVLCDGVVPRRFLAPVDKRHLCVRQQYLCACFNIR